MSACNRWNFRDKRRPLSVEESKGQRVGSQSPSTSSAPKSRMLCDTLPGSFRALDHGNAQEPQSEDASEIKKTSGLNLSGLWAKKYFTILSPSFFFCELGKKNLSQCYGEDSMCPHM